MKISSRKSSPNAKGTSLMEVMIAVGVLAIAIPLVFGAMIQSGESNLSAQAETRSSWIVQSCFEEIQYAMRGESKYLRQLTPGKSFPESGNVEALVFSGESSILGSISKGEYDRGIVKLANKPARYIALMSAEEENAGTPDAAGVLNVKITLEYPAASPAAKRKKIDFHTRIP